MKTAIFLGAGASAAEGAPIQSRLFKEYFQLLKERNNFYSQEHERKLATFFQLMFDIDVDRADLETINFPTFEEALSILDLADLKNEAFKDISNISFAVNSGRLKFLKIYLIFLMADIINEKLMIDKKIHKQLINQLDELNLIEHTFFITTNYDILCDNALLRCHPEKNVDYGIDFVNYKEGELEKPNHECSKLFKLHGSLNWLYCPTCNNIRLTPYEKGVATLIRDLTKSYCKICQTIYSPIIIPPTFYKDLSNVFLHQVWNKAENELLDAQHVIFCGYSFPDADIHIKYLIKRIQKNRQQTKTLRITVINNHENKRSDEKDQERKRYTRFLGSQVNYTEYSFEEFANEPEKVMN